jgi:DNA primase
MPIIYNPNALFTVTGRSGDEFYVLCPFHNDSNSSASFNGKTGLFHCFACAMGLTVRRLCYELDVSTEDIKMKPGQEVTITAPIRDREDLSKSWLEWYSSPLAIDNWYLKFRGVNNDLIGRYSILAADDAIVFSQIHPGTGMAQGVQLRNLKYSPKYKFIGKRTALWPMQDLKIINPDLPVYLTEGNFGALRAISAGLQAFSCQSVGGIEKAIPILTGLNVIAVFDDDKAGTLGLIKAALAGFKIASPTFEADEAFVDEWIDFHNHLKERTTRSIKDIADKLENKDTVRKIMKRNVFRYQLHG